MSEQNKALSQGKKAGVCHVAAVTISVVFAMIFFAYYYSYHSATIAGNPNMFEYTGEPIIYQPSYPGANYSVEYRGIPGHLLVPIISYYSKLEKRLANTDTTNAESAALSENDVVFLTANSEDHFEESMGAVVGIQSCFPKARTIYYDLGLTEEQRERLESVCSVEVRTLDFGSYPSYVALLEEKRWKPIVVHRVLSEFPLVFWVDASVRFACDGESRRRGFHHFWSQSVQLAGDAGAVMFSRSSHNNYPVIHPDTYHYLPTDVAAMQRTPEYESNSVLFNGRHLPMMVSVMRWWLLCALHARCMHPKAVAPGVHDDYERWHECKFHGHREYATCHRQDQSTLNMLLLNLYNFDWRRFVNDQPTYGNGYLRIRRDEMVDWKQVRMCH